MSPKTGTGLPQAVRDIAEDPLIGEQARAQLHYYSTVTRELHARMGRITDRITSGDLFSDLNIPAAQFDPAHDRAMLCGSMAMIKYVAAVLESHGLVEGSNANPGDFVLERAVVG